MNHENLYTLLMLHCEWQLLPNGDERYDEMVNAMEPYWNKLTTEESLTIRHVIDTINSLDD